MKKCWLLMLIIMCGLLTACKKNSTKDTVVEEIEEIPGVEVIQEVSQYTYTLSEQQDGGLLFTINGSWENGSEWKVECEDDAVALANVVEQSNGKTKITFVPEEGKDGYSEYTITLHDKETNEEIYRYVIPVMIEPEDKKLSAVKVNSYDSSQKENETANEEEEVVEDVEEDTEEDVEEDTELENKKTVTFRDVVGNMKFADEFVDVSTQVEEFSDRKNGKYSGEVFFTYKDYDYICIIAPNTPLSYLQKTMVIDAEAYELKNIGDVEVYVYTELGSRILMWKDTDGIRYVLGERKNSGEFIFEVVNLLMNK